jgi:hypothetical protein
MDLFEAFLLAILRQIAFRLQLGVSPLLFVVFLVEVILDFVAELVVAPLAELAVAPPCCRCFDVVVFQVGLPLRPSHLRGWTAIHNTHPLVFEDRRQLLEVYSVDFLYDLLPVVGRFSFGQLILLVIFW